MNLQKVIVVFVISFFAVLCCNSSIILGQSNERDTKSMYDSLLISSIGYLNTKMLEPDIITTVKTQVYTKSGVYYMMTITENEKLKSLAISTKPKIENSPGSFLIIECDGDCSTGCHPVIEGNNIECPCKGYSIDGCDMLISTIEDFHEQFYAIGLKYFEKVSEVSPLVIKD
jgi:hypothetical protein